MRPSWVEQQLVGRGIRDERVLEAMARVPRELFLREAERGAAYLDEALPICHGQTISQPYMVARICEELRLRGDERVLDVGTGSGYQAAVLAVLAGEVHTIERIPELTERARAALTGAGFASVTVHTGDGSLGVPEHAPYGGIAVAAAAPGVPPPLLAQLARGARLVVPVGSERDQRLQVIEQAEGGPSVVHSVPCRFVPLVGEEGFAVVGRGAEG